MESFEELPDGDGENAPVGNSPLTYETLRPLLNDLHETIVGQVLDGKPQYTAVAAGREVTFQLPKKEQLFEFTSISGGGNDGYRVVLMIPSVHLPPGEEDIYHTRCFDYLPPNPPDTPYLPAFSQN